MKHVQTSRWDLKKKTLCRKLKNNWWYNMYQYLSTTGPALYCKYERPLLQLLWQKPSEGSRTDVRDKSASSNLKSSAPGCAIAHSDPLCLHWFNHRVVAEHTCFHTNLCTCQTAWLVLCWFMYYPIDARDTHSSQWKTQTIKISLCSHYLSLCHWKTGDHQQEIFCASWPPLFVWQKWHLILILEWHF